MNYLLLLTLVLVTACNLGSGLPSQVWDQDYDAYFLKIENLSDMPVEMTVGSLFTTTEMIDYSNGSVVKATVLPGTMVSLTAHTQQLSWKYNHDNSPGKRITTSSYKLQITGLASGTFTAAGWPKEFSNDQTPQYFGLFYSLWIDDTNITTEEEANLIEAYDPLKSSLLPPGKKFTDQRVIIIVTISSDGQVSFSLDQTTLDSLADIPVN